jgi:hypothetical protein
MTVIFRHSLQLNEKRLIGFSFRSARLSVRLYLIGSHWTDFLEIFYGLISLKSLWKVHFFFRIWHKNSDTLHKGLNKFCVCWWHYWLTPGSRVPLEKLTDLQLVKKFPAFYGTRRFFTAITIAHHVSLSRASPIQSSHPHPTSWKIHPNIILPSTPGSPQRSLSLRFPHQNPVHTYTFPPYVLHASPISIFSILSPARYWVRSTNHWVPHYVIFSIPPLPRPS